MMRSRDLWRWLRADLGLWRGHAWRIAGERGERVGVLQFYADGTGFDELTGEFDVDAWERGSRMLRFPLTRTGWRSAHEAARWCAHLTIPTTWRERCPDIVGVGICTA